MNGTAEFVVTLDKQSFPHWVQSARKPAIDGLTLYAENAGALASVIPAADLAELLAGLSGATGQAQLSPPDDSTVMTRETVKAGISRPFSTTLVTRNPGAHA